MAVKSHFDQDYLTNPNNPTYKQFAGYINNTGWFGEKGVISTSTGIEIKGVKFHDFSYMYGDKGVKAVNGALIAPLNNQGVTPSNAQIQTALTNYANGTDNIDHLNKLFSMVYTNWNGAEIVHGDFATGNNYIISTTPEFLSIFNSISEKVYDEIIVKTLYIERIIRQKAITQSINATTNITGLSGIVINDKEIVNIMYLNSTANEIFITINNNITLSNLNTCKFKVPDGNQLAITIQPYGFGEISYMRIGTTIYARGI